MVSLMMVVMEFTMVEDGDSVPDDGDGGVNHDGEDGDGVPYDGGCGIHYGEEGDGVSDDGNGGGGFHDSEDGDGVPDDGNGDGVTIYVDDGVAAGGPSGDASLQFYRHHGPQLELASERESAILKSDQPIQNTAIVS